MRLRIGRETRIGQRRNIHRLQPAAAFDSQGRADALHLDARVPQFVEHGVQMIRSRSVNRHLAIRRRCRNGKRRRFDPVGNDLVMRAMQFLDPGDRDGGTSRAQNLRTHRDQKIGEIHHLGFAGGAFNDRDALRENRRHHHIRSAQHRWTGSSTQKQIGSLQPGRGGPDVAAFDDDLCTQCLEPFQMKIDGPRANDASAGQRDGRFVQTAEQRSHDANRAAHLANQIVIAVRLDLRGLHGHGVALHLHLGAQRFQDLPHELHIAQVRHVVDGARLGGEQRRRQNGQDGIFCTTDTHIAVQWHAAFDQQTIHESLSLKFSATRAGCRKSLPTQTRNHQPVALTVVRHNHFDNPLVLQKQRFNRRCLSIPELDHETTARSQAFPRPDRQLAIELQSVRAAVQGQTRIEIPDLWIERRDLRRRNVGRIRHHQVKS